MAPPSLKIDIPAPAAKNSKAFTAALKVCLAAAAFDVALDYSTGKASLVNSSGNSVADLLQLQAKIMSSSRLPRTISL